MLKSKGIIILVVSGLALFILMVVSIVTFFDDAVQIKNEFDAKIDSSKKMYPYETYWGAVNDILIIEDTEHREELIEYYRKVEKHDEDASFDFPLKTLPQTEPVYILGYSDDSVLVKVVSFYDRGPKFGGSTLVGYVLRSMLHELPPPNDSIPALDTPKK